MNPQLHVDATGEPIDPGSPQWNREAAQAVYDLPFNDLLFRAQTIHRENFDTNRVQLSRLLSIKTGGCPEDCGYCSQSSHHQSGLKASKLMANPELMSSLT
jgi:biotin synthase